MALSYVRVTVLMPGPDGRDTKRTFWAVDQTTSPAYRRFQVVDKGGDRPEPTEYVFAYPADVLKEEQARMNLTYAELEVK